MKKLFVFFHGDGSSSRIDSVTDELRAFGALHIEVPASESQYRSDLNRTLNILSALKKQKPKKADKEASYYVNRTLELFNEKKRLQDSLKENERIVSFYKNWGDFSVGTVKKLNASSLFVNLYEILIDDFDKSLLEKNNIFLISRDKKIVRLLQIVSDEEDKLEGLKREIIPETESTTLSKIISDIHSKIKDIDSQLLELASYIPLIKEAIIEEDKVLEKDAVVRRGIKDTELSELITLEGFIPAEKISDFEKYAAEKGWGYGFREPIPEDEPPTEIKSSKLVQPVHALYDIIGLNTGYYETDVSAIFYLFYIIFTALLIGDAGYGSLFLLLTLVANIIVKKPNYNFLALGYILSAATVVWGALIGNWFGSETIAGIPFIQQLTVPQFASFDVENGGMKNSTDIMMRISFGVAITHLTIAHLISAWQRIKSLEVIGQLAWISFLWGIYFLLNNLIFKDVLHPYFMHQMVTSMVLILIFSETKDGILNGMKSTALTAPFDFIGGLSDVASYLRLFAVGTAALMLASVFNNLAEGAGLFAPILLLVGHVFNIVLALFGVFVHATRLETVEFSNHAQLEWAGKKYKPFKV
ncbi:MAG: hypothetical protein JXR91_10695 [Deltaproteobacteria bacterium]|nr:hypothetical protein [Deltaproteobacteria bacterium]